MHSRADSFEARALIQMEQDSKIEFKDFKLFKKGAQISI